MFAESLNCMQVHAYTVCPNNQTAYLAELQSGKEVLIVNASGQQKTAIVGRVKIETRPLVSMLHSTSCKSNTALFWLSAICSRACKWFVSCESVHMFKASVHMSKARYRSPPFVCKFAHKRRSHY